MLDGHQNAGAIPLLFRILLFQFELNFVRNRDTSVCTEMSHFVTVPVPNGLVEYDSVADAPELWVVIVLEQVSLVVERSSTYNLRL